MFDNSKTIIERDVNGLFFHVPYKNGIVLKRLHSAVLKWDFKFVKFQDNGELFLYNIATDKEEKREPWI